MMNTLKMKEVLAMTLIALFEVLAGGHYKYSTCLYNFCGMCSLEDSALASFDEKYDETDAWKEEVEEEMGSFSSCGCCCSHGREIHIQEEEEARKMYSFFNNDKEGFIEEKYSHSYNSTMRVYIIEWLLDYFASISNTYYFMKTNKLGCSQ